jgi:hypothetical protein
MNTEGALVIAMRANAGLAGHQTSRGGSGSVVVFVSATVTAVPGLSNNVTSTLTRFTSTTTGNRTGFCSSAMRRA